MIESFTCATFRPHLGETFRLTADGVPPVDVVLGEAEELSGSSTSQERAPFSVVFKGPSAPVLPQSIYRLDHPDIGSFELFLVPIGEDAAGVSYQAVFS